jgi:hypothetical protein
MVTTPSNLEVKVIGYSKLLAFESYSQDPIIIEENILFLIARSET